MLVPKLPTKPSPLGNDEGGEAPSREPHLLRCCCCCVRVCACWLCVCGLASHTYTSPCSVVTAVWVLQAEMDTACLPAKGPPTSCDQRERNIATRWAQAEVRHVVIGLT
jgi:hypothetical protein